MVRIELTYWRLSSRRIEVSTGCTCTMGSGGAGSVAGDGSCSCFAHEALTEPETASKRDAVRTVVRRTFDGSRLCVIESSSG
jgi:hypothetical protein